MFEPYDYYTFTEIFERFIPSLLQNFNSLFNGFLGNTYLFVPKMFLGLCLVSFTIYVLRRVLNRVF